MADLFHPLRSAIRSGQNASAVPLSKLPFGFRSRLGLKPRCAHNERVYAIGDIHGRYDLLKRMLTRIEDDNMRRTIKPVRLIVLGDFIDRGSRSANVTKELRRICRNTNKLVVLQGNHESTLLDCAAGDAEAQEHWLRFGGDATLRSFGISLPGNGEDPASFADRIVGGVGVENLDWLASLPVSTQSGDYFFCHAGVRPYIPLHRQSHDDLLTIRDEFLDSELNHGAVIVHGHSIVADGAEFRPNRINVDSGAFRTGKLTAVGLDGTEQWLVEAWE